MANVPQHPAAIGGSGRHDAALQQAMLALDSQRPGDAERITGEILKRDPRHAGALVVLGRALLSQGRAEEAIAPLESAARGRHDPYMDTQLAIALRQADRKEDALGRLRRTVKRHPTFVPALHELGRLLVAMGRYAEAIEALSRAIELAPMMPELSTQLGYALLSNRNGADAKTAFARALEIVPASPVALYGMAKALQELGNNQAAETYFRRYLITMPGDQNAWLSLGHCLLELGQSESGYECFRMAARGNARRYGEALTSLAAATRGRLWLKPSAASRFLRGEKGAPAASASALGTAGDKPPFPD